MSNDAVSVLSVARAEIGYCRWDDPATGTKYGRWYAEGHGSYYGTNGVPFCAMFVSWVFDLAGAECAGLPEAYCPYILNEARRAGMVLADKAKAQPGDVVLFDWDGGVVDHVGIVELNKESYVQTIEGNTTINGRSGSVGRRTRSWSQVAAVVRPSWGAQASEPSGELVVDGIWGRSTTLRLQEVLGAPYRDGAISRQPLMWLGRHAGCGTGWEYAGESGEEPGSQTVALVQRACGVGEDGFCGPETINAIIRRFAGESGATVEDGRIDCPSPTVMAMQRALNEGRF